MNNHLTGRFSRGEILGRQPAAKTVVFVANHHVYVPAAQLMQLSALWEVEGEQ